VSSTPPETRPAPRAARVVAVALRARPGDGPSASAVVRMALTLVLVAALLYVIWVSRTVILWVAVAAFLAVAINPAVQTIQSRLRIPRAVSIGVVYLLGLALMAGAALVFVPPLIDAGGGLAEDIPEYVQDLERSRFVQDLDREYGVLEQVEERATEFLSGIAGPTTAVDIATRVVNGLLALVSIAVIAFLFSLYGPRIRAWVIAQADEGRERATGLIDGMYRVIAGYVVGVLSVAVVGATTAAVFMTIAGIPYVPVLALWVGLMALIPLVGAVLGAVPYIVVGFFQGIGVGIAAVVFLAVYQQLENNVVQPFIHRRTVNLNPLWIIIAVLVGTQVLGIVGALVAIPVAGIVQVLVVDWLAHRDRDDRPPEVATPPPEAPVTAEGTEAA
jgi:predicted PurR-regulated permease PerM